LGVVPNQLSRLIGFFGPIRRTAQLVFYSGGTEKFPTIVPPSPKTAPAHFAQRLPSFSWVESAGPPVFSPPAQSVLSPFPCKVRSLGEWVRSPVGRVHGQKLAPVNSWGRSPPPQLGFLAFSPRQLLSWTNPPEPSGRKFPRGVGEEPFVLPVMRCTKAGVKRKRRISYGPPKLSRAETFSPMVPPPPPPHPSLSDLERAPVPLVFCFPQKTFSGITHLAPISVGGNRTPRPPQN